MEKSHVKNVISNLFAYRVQIFGEGSVYRGFESDLLDENKNQKNKDGFNSTILYGKILYENAEGVTLKSDPVMIKFMPEVRLSKWILFSFTNEIVFYTKILPVLSTREASLFPLFPKFYHGEIIFGVEEDHSAIILEDLAVRGYRMAKKKSFLDYQHLALMMRKLGQFHAHSYKAKNMVPHLFHPLAKNRQETNWILNEEWIGWLVRVCQRGLQQLQRDPAYSAFLEKLTELIQDSENIFKQILTGGSDNPVSVIVHGDYVRNNVMFKYENNILEDLVIVDMATYRYGSPVIDLVSVMYLHASQEMRNEHWDDLIDEYYTAMKETFPENRVPSKDEILSEFVDKSFYGYLIASYFLQFLIAKDNNTGSKNFDDFYLPSNEVSTHAEVSTTDFEMLTQVMLVAGGNEASKALGDILRDLIDRGFICK